MSLSTRAYLFFLYVYNFTDAGYQQMPHLKDVGALSLPQL